MYTCKLTEEEKQNKIEEVARAFQNEREEIKHLEEGLTNTLTNDAYFKDEINRIVNNNAYVTEHELKNYIDSVIRQELTTCDLVEIEEDVYSFSMPLSNTKVLKTFMDAYPPVGEEAEAAYRRFLADIQGKDTIRLTFNQQKAYDDRSLYYLNIYHPMIQACLNYFLKKDDKAKTTFCYAIEDTKKQFDGKAYYLAIYQLSTHRIVQGVEKRTETLFPLLYDVTNDRIIEDKAIVDNLFSKSQNLGIEHNASSKDISRDIVENMRYDFAEALGEEITVKIGELKKQAESDRFRTEQQTLEYYKTRIANIQKSLDEQEANLDYLQFVYFDNPETREKKRRGIEGAIRLFTANIAQLEKDRDSHLEMINRDPEIGIERELLSINLINII